MYLSPPTLQEFDIAESNQQTNTINYFNKCTPRKLDKRYIILL